MKSVPAHPDTVLGGRGLFPLGKSDFLPVAVLSATKFPYARARVENFTPKRGSPDAGQNATISGIEKGVNSNPEAV